MNLCQRRKMHFLGTIIPMCTCPTCTLKSKSGCFQPNLTQIRDFFLVSEIQPLISPQFNFLWMLQLPFHYFPYSLIYLMFILCCPSLWKEKNYEAAKYNCITDAVGVKPDTKAKQTVMEESYKMPCQ